MSVKQILKKYFGYDDFREGQEGLIESILKGQDTFGIMPTGAGKSICYQVPALAMEGITLAISPLISLMKDQVQALNQAGIHAAYINSSLTAGQNRTALQRAKTGQYKIIYVAPERLDTIEFLDFAINTRIDMVTIDEAHCISRWGQDFRPSYLKIVDFINKLPKRPVISAFTATATKDVMEDIICVLGLKNPNLLITGFDRKNLYFEVQMPKNKDTVILDYIEKHPKDSGIIYCSTRKSVEEVCNLLLQNGTLATRYHAGLIDEERSQNQDDFIYDQKPVMVATNAFGMGIDKSNVRFVIHYNMPKDMESYYQEAGRAGRDGETAECILLYAPKDVAVNQYMIENGNDNDQLTHEELELIRERDRERLKKMTYYCFIKGCLREYILRYFGEKPINFCQNCNNCLTQYEEIDVTEISKDIIGCVMDCRGRYGVNVIIATLCGKKLAKLNAYGLHKIQYYGKLADTGEERLKQIISQLLVEGMLYQTNDKFALLKLGESAREVYEGLSSVVMKLMKEEITVKKEGKDKKVKRSELLTSKGLDLFEELRMARAKLAREEHMPPYIIFSDKTLTDMCVKLPFTKEEMLAVSGVGENKYEKYGQAFIEAILKYTNGQKTGYYYEEEHSVEETSRKKEKSERKQKQEFYLTEETLKSFIYKDRVTISDLVGQLNDLRDDTIMKRLTVASVTKLLMDKGYIEEGYNAQTRFNHKIATEQGKEIGITAELRISEKGNEYEVLNYNENAQRLILGLVKEMNGAGLENET